MERRTDFSLWLKDGKIRGKGLQPLAEDLAEDLVDAMDSFYFSEAVIEKCCPSSIDQ